MAGKKRYPYEKLRLWFLNMYLGNEFYDNRDLRKAMYLVWVNKFPLPSGPVNISACGTLSC